MDTSVLGVINENIISVLKTVSYQNTIENIYRIDKNTGLNSFFKIINKYGSITEFIENFNVYKNEKPSINIKSS